MPTQSSLRRRLIDAYGRSCEWPGCSEPNTGIEIAHLHSRGMGGNRNADSPGNVMIACWLHARITDGEGGGFRPFHLGRIDPTIETLKMLETVHYEELPLLKWAIARNDLKTTPAIAYHRAEALRAYLKSSRPFEIEETE